MPESLTPLESATKQARPYEERFAGLKDDNNFFAALAMETYSQANGGSAFAGITRTITVDDLDQATTLVDAGKRIFARWNRTLYEFACKPTDEDKGLRDDLLHALTGKEGGTAVVAGVLVTAFGMAVAPAALVAALLVKLVVAPGMAEACQIWTESIEGASPRGK